MGYNANFATWLQQELDLRGWNQSDLSKAAGVARSTISNILNMQRSPGPAVCLAVANALKLPPAVVFIRAGLMPEVQGMGHIQEEVIYKLTKLSTEKQQTVLDLVDSLLARSEKESRKAGKGAP